MSDSDVKLSGVKVSDDPKHDVCAQVKIDLYCDCKPDVDPCMDCEYSPGGCNCGWFHARNWKPCEDGGDCSEPEIDILYNVSTPYTNEEIVDFFNRQGGGIVGTWLISDGCDHDQRDDCDDIYKCQRCYYVSVK